jgi:hypothetical protein
MYSEGSKMLVSIVKWAATAAVLLAAMSWRLPSHYEVLLDFVFCLVVGIVAFRAIRATEYAWAAGFVTIAIMLNPAVPFFAPAGNLAALMALVFVAPLAIASAALSVQPAFCGPSLHGGDEFASV